MKKFIPLVDWLTFGGLALFGIVGAILVLCTKQDWDIVKIVAIFIPLTAFTAVPIIVLIIKWVSKPDYLTAQGSYVWTNGLDIPRLLLSQALDFYVDRVSKKFDIKENFLLLMLSGARLDFRKDRINIISMGYTLRDKAGLQIGKLAIIAWTGKIYKSALFHELNHMVDEIVLKRHVDYVHKNKAWWEFADKTLAEEFKNMEGL